MRVRPSVVRGTAQRQQARSSACAADRESAPAERPARSTSPRASWRRSRTTRLGSSSATTACTRRRRPRCVLPERNPPDVGSRDGVLLLRVRTSPRNARDAILAPAIPTLPARHRGRSFPRLRVPRATELRARRPAVGRRRLPRVRRSRVMPGLGIVRSCLGHREDRPLAARSRPGRMAAFRDRAWRLPTAAFAGAAADVDTAAAGRASASAPLNAIVRDVAEPRGTAPPARPADVPRGQAPARAPARLRDSGRDCGSPPATPRTAAAVPDRRSSTS